MKKEYEQPSLAVVIFTLHKPVADEYDPDSPSNIEDGFEKWPED